MSLATRCPACATTFKVVRDQLRISDGWVRCGRCSHVFDATLDLHETPDPAGEAGEAGASPSLPIAIAIAPAPTNGAAPPPQIFPQPPSAASSTQEVSFSLSSVEPPGNAAPADWPSPEPDRGMATWPQPPSFAPEPSPEPLPLPQVDEADFLDDDMGEHNEQTALEAQAAHGDPMPPQHEPPPVVPLPSASAEPSSMATLAQASAPPGAGAGGLSLPVHGIVADEPWSDLDARVEPEWRPPPTSLPPFPDIDLDLGASLAVSPPPPPLPAVHLRKPDAFVAPSEDDERTDAGTLRADAQADEEDRGATLPDGDDAKEIDDDRDDAQIRKALRRARARSAKIADARARHERGGDAASPIAQAPGEPMEPGFLPFASTLDEADLAEEADEVGFLDDAGNDGSSSRWHRPGVRRGLIALAVLAVAVLVVQVLRHERDGIVARQPSLRPALAALCQATGCELSPLRRIGDIVIEGAAFAREKSGGNDYRLSFELRSSATVPLAMPSVELALLDTQERTVVRRVLSPSDYGAPPVLAARGERAASLPMTLTATEAAALPPIAGYHLEAFYP